MKTFVPRLAALALSIPLAGHAETALSALRALSTVEARNLIEVTARQESAAPERWSFTVYDAGVPSHQRRVEVARGQVLSSQEVVASGAATPAGDPWDAGEIKLDSDRAGDLALSYAAANRVKFAAMDFALRRQGAKAVPVWIVSCLNPKNESLGSLVISSSSGDVVASEGFPNGPETAPRVAAVAERPVAPQVAAASVTSQVEASDQAFLRTQVEQSPAEPAATRQLADEAPAPVTRVAPKAKAAATPAPRVLVWKREVPPEPVADDTVVETRVVTRAPADSYDRRERVETYDASEDEAPRKKLHIGRFLHRLFHGEE